jgi:hypothetical protein
MAFWPSTDTHNRSMGRCTQIRSTDIQIHILQIDILGSSGSCGEALRACGDGGGGGGGGGGHDAGGGHDGGFERSMSARVKASLREQLPRVGQQEPSVLSEQVRVPVVLLEQQGVPVVLLEQQGAERVVERWRARNTP